MGAGVVSGAAALALILGRPERAARLEAAGWTALLTIARAERLIGTLAYRLEGVAVPGAVAAILHDAEVTAGAERDAALWEAEMARRALAPLGVPVVLLKGAAYAVSGVAAGIGRSIGDLDILVPRDALPAVEAALLAAGWEWLKSDPYDDSYYRRWMHELPPLIHRTRDRMIDVHHTILPLTARPQPDAAALIDARVPVSPGGAIMGEGLFTLSPADQVVHAAAHLFADGDLAGGLRNLWDIGRLLADAPAGLAERAAHHGLAREVALTRRLAMALFDGEGLEMRDRPFARRLLARDGWGRATRPATRLAFYVRSHWLRMPPWMLARHLFVKACRS